MMNATQLETFHRLDDLQHLDAAATWVQQWLLNEPDNALAWAAQARLHYRQGLIVQAHAAAKKALALQPGCDDAIWMLALLDEQDVRAALRQCVLAYPNHDRALASLGYELIGGSDEEMGEAEALLRRAIALRPERGRARANLALLLRTLGRTEESDALYVELAAMFPDEALSQYDAGTALQQSRRYQEAQPYLDEAVRLFGENFEAQHNRAQNLQALERHDEAIAEWDRILTGKEALASDLVALAEQARAISIYRRAYVDWEQHRYGAVMAQLDPLLAAGVEDPYVWNLSGLCRLRQGQVAEALPLFTRAAELGGEHWFVHGNLADALLQLEDHSAALASAERAIALAPQKSFPHRYRGDALLALSRAKEAVAAFEQVLALAPNDESARMSLVSALQHGDRHEAALAHCDTLEQCENRGAWANWSRGVSLEALGRREQAAAAFEAAKARYLAAGNEKSAALCEQALVRLKKPAGFFARLLGRG